MKQAKERYSVKIFAYCLMPNHFHMVLMSDKGEDLSKWMQWLMTSHVRRYHRHYGSSGHIWQGRFKSFIIQRDEHLLMVLRYVEGNPVRAGLVRSAKDWLWSSHNARIVREGQSLSSKETVPFIDELPIEIPKAWNRYVDEPLTEKESESLRRSVNRQSPFGDFEWQGRISKEFGLESTLRQRGRPGKGAEK
jgi:putative transposase